MNVTDLKKFLIKISKEGYATNNESAWKKEEDKSTTIVNSDGDFRMHDNFFGGEPYGGREVIFYKSKPEWIMVYYGKVDKNVEKPQDVYAVLQKALSNTDPDFPVRGPKMFLSLGMQYLNHWHGDVKEFEGSESITFNGREIYTASYRGGLVDQREE